MPLDSSLRNAIIAISIIALLIVIVAITVLPIGQAQNASNVVGTFATTGGCGAGSFVTTVGNTTIACSAYPAQTNEYYGSCPGAGQAATAITTTTLNCATFLTTQTSAFFSYGACGSPGYVTAVTTTTLNCGVYNIFNQCQLSVGYTVTALVMLGATCSFTPVTSSFAVFFYALAYTSAAGFGYYGAIRYGTGSAPVQGTAATGSNPCFPFSEVLDAAGVSIGASAFCEISGLTIGTAYWFDVAVQESGGGIATATFQNEQWLFVGS